MNWGSRLKKTSRLLTTGLLDLVLPAICPVCHTSVSYDEPTTLCNSCRQTLPVLESPVCSICGIPFHGAGVDHPCSTCLKTPPPYHAARAAMLYEGICKELIHQFKYTGKTHLRRPLGQIMADHLHDFAVSRQADLLVPVPLHRAKLRSRGFNQSVLLAELLAESWQIPLLRDGLIKTHPTTPQIQLTKEQRQKNQQHAFAVRTAPAVAGARVILVDDVFTTGSTLSACADALLHAGCLSVSAVTAAHAP